MKNSSVENPGAVIATTSLILKYDGLTLGNITLPINPSLNDVLEAINVSLAAAAAVDHTSAITVYDGTTPIGNIIIPANTSLNGVIQIVAQAVSDLQDAIVAGGSLMVADGVQINVPYDNLAVSTFQDTEVVTSNTGAHGVVVSHTGANLVLKTVTGYFLDEDTLTGGTSGTTAEVNGRATTVLHNLPEKDAGHSVPDQVGIVPAIVPVEGAVIQPINPAIDAMPFGPTDRSLGGMLEGIKNKLSFLDLNANSRVAFEYLRNTLTGLFDNFASVAGGITTGGGSLSISIAKSNYYISGRRIFVPASTPLMIATSDNYVDVTYAGVYVVTAVAISAGAPALAANSLRLFKVTTNGSGVTGVVALGNTYPISNGYIGNNAIVTRNILDANVTASKLVDQLTPDSGTYPFPSVTLTKKGIVTNIASLVNFTGIANKQLMWYDSGSGKWVNVNKIGDILPGGGSNNDLLYFSTGGNDFFTASLANILEANNIESIFKNSLVIPTATVKTLGTPLDLVAAPGAGKELILVSASGKETFATTPYDTHTQLDIITESNNSQATDAWLLKSTLTKSSRFTINGTDASASEVNVAENKKLQIVSIAGNPATGDSDLKIYYKYYIQVL